MANEKRLIDKDALIELCDSPHWCVWMTEIEDFPTVDAVEVVRCKDCKHAVNCPFMADSQKLVCTKSVNWRAAEPDHFCSYGERREGE